MSADFYKRISDKPKPKKHGAVIIVTLAVAIVGVIALYLLVMLLFPILKMNHYSLPG